MRNAVLRFIPDATPVLTLNFRVQPHPSQRGTSGRMRIALLTGIAATIAAAATDAPQQIHIACELKLGFLVVSLRHESHRQNPRVVVQRLAFAVDGSDIHTNDGMIISWVTTGNTAQSTVHYGTSGDALTNTATGTQAMYLPGEGEHRGWSRGEYIGRRAPSQLPTAAL